MQEMKRDSLMVWRKSMEEAEGTGGVQSIERAFAIIKLLDAQGELELLK